MKTVGQILKTAREQKKFTLEDVHKFIKIHPKFLIALEEGEYQIFSNKIHAKGFLKIYSEFLGLDVPQVLAFWRREYEAMFEKRESLLPKFKVNHLQKVGVVLTPSLVLITLSVFLTLSFFSYLFYQYHTYSGAPKLDIYNPQNNVVINYEILDVTGKTDIDANLMINNQKINLDKDGGFATSIRLQPGLNTLSFLSVNKLQKETEEIRTIIYRNPEQENVSSILPVVESTQSTRETPGKFEPDTKPSIREGGGLEFVEEFQLP
ncbi:helix-turn-helix domain-containing protein [candidate division WWE3 bacterium]|nr:helix-turn-helix domain-containing protein [candidate division WWE3 bacterium]